MLLHLRILPWGTDGGGAGRPGGAWIGEPGRSRPGTDLAGATTRRCDRWRGYFDEPGAATGPDSGTWVSGLADIAAAPGTLFRVRTPGAGGWGAAWERDPDAVLRDVRDGYVTVAGARRDYGVAVTGDPETGPAALAVDRTGTDELRGSPIDDDAVRTAGGDPELSVTRTDLDETCPSCGAAPCGLPAAGGHRGAWSPAARTACTCCAASRARRRSGSATCPTPRTSRICRSSGGRREPGPASGSVGGGALPSAVTGPAPSPSLGASPIARAGVGAPVVPRRTVAPSRLWVSVPAWARAMWRGAPRRGPRRRRG